MEETQPNQRKCGALIAQNRLVELYPGIRQRQLALEDATRARRATGVVVRRGLLTLPVYVHVVYRSDRQNISDEQIQSQIDVLNQDYRAANPDITKVPEVWRGLATDAQLKFRIVDITRTQTDHRAFTTDDAVKFSESGGHDAIEPDTHINFWICKLANDLLGYAQFPGGPPETDGVVILHSAFGTEGTAAPPFDLGRTATHEVGHYLNLHHVFGDSPVPNCNDDDFISDTPTQLGPNFGKPRFPSISCSNGPNGDMTVDFMDYSDDDSMHMFTAQQVLRMRTALAHERPNLGSR